MPKRNAKINNDNLLPPQTRSLRSRKNKSPSDESVLTDDDRSTLSQKSAEGDAGSVAVALQCPLQESAVTIKQHHQAADPSCLLDQDGLTKEKGTEMTNVNITNVAVRGQENTNPSSDSQLETSGINTETDTKKNEKNREEAGQQQHGCNNLPNQTSTDPLQVLKDESTVLEEQIYARRNLNLEKTRDKPSTCTSDAEESTAGLPAKKRRRTGHSLLNQLRENWPNGTESTEKQIYDKPPKSVTLGEEIPSASASLQHVSADCITERSEVEPTPQNRHHRISCEHRAETEVQIAVATSDGTSILCDPDSLEGKTCRVSWPVPELTDNPVSHEHAEEEEECLDNQQLQEHTETTSENRAEMSEKQMGAGEGESAEVNLRSTVTSQMEESDKNEGEASFLQMNHGNKAGDEKNGCTTDDGVKEAISSALTQTGSLGCGVKTLCEALLTHSVQEVKNNCNPEDDCAPGSSAGCTRTGGPDDTFGFGCPDYVSDSQLNTIVLVDEKMAEKNEPDLEDATALICGLIGELSSLNQKVMVAHRQLENLWRKNPKSFPR